MTTTQNVDELTAKAGGDTYNINGGTLTIDQNSRVGLNQTTSASLGAVTLSATLGGTLNIDGRYVRIIPYDTGTGNVPAWNTTISKGSASGKLIGVYSALTVASTATDAAMPASGYIKIKQWNSIAYTAGSLTGIGANATGADVAGWLEIVGDEAATINANRLGTVNILGEWYRVGTTNGTSNQTMQIPNEGLLRYIAGVFIEKTVGQADYEFYPNAGTTTTTGTEATRGKVVWIDANGLVRIGNSGSATNGYTPVTGLAVVVGNIFFENCTTAARTANVIPNATVGTRYDFTTTGGGVINIDKCNCAWYLSCTQAYSVALSNSGFVDAINMQEIAQNMTWNKVGIGNKPTTSLVVSPLTMLYCFAGGTFTNCVFAMVSQGSSGNHILTLTDIANFTFVTCTIRANTIRGNATAYAVNGTRMVNCTFTSPTVIQGCIYMTTCNGITMTDEIYCDCVSGNTVTTYAMYVWNMLSNTINCTFSGLTFPIANTHPYTAIMNIGAAGCSNIKVRNIGTYATPLTCGSVNIMGNVINLVANAAATDIKVQRVYVANTRVNGIYYISATSPDNTSSRITFENVFTDYADASDLNNMLNLTRKGIGGTPALTAATAIYGTHFIDCHTSTTAGRFIIIMNETTSLTTSQVTLSNGAAFTSAGGLYMPTIGMLATFELPYYVIGHTGFQNSALVMAGGTATNYTYRYQIDKNDGNGFSTWSASKTATTLGTALNGEQNIDAAKGFKLKLEITTGTTNTTAITSAYLLTTSTTTTQAYQYPLDVVTLGLTGLKVNSEVRAYVGTDPATATEIGGIENSGTSFSFTHSSGGQAGYIEIFALGYVSIQLNLTYLSSDQSIPVQQQLDRQYYNPA